MNQGILKPKVFLKYKSKTNINMKNILIFAALEGIASAIVIYFVTEEKIFDDNFIADIE